jgi:WD40 repeat protein
MKFYTDDLLLSCAPADHLICCWNVNRLALVKTISASQDVTSLDIFKDEILTINSNNSVSFIPINDDVSGFLFLFCFVFAAIYVIC